MSRRGRILGIAVGVLVAVLLVVLIVSVAVAQEGGRPGRRGRGGPPMMMGPMMRPMIGMMSVMAPPAIAVANGKVFVAAAGKLYRFNAETLELEMEATYAKMPEMPGGAGGPGGPPLPPPGAPPGPAPAPGGQPGQ